MGFEYIDRKNHPCHALAEKDNTGMKSVLGYVSAIANEGGGYLVFGIREASPHEVQSS